MVIDPALLIVDMQVALVTGAYREREVIERISALSGRMRAAHRPVIYVQHNHASFAPMRKGAAGWRIHPDLAPAAGDPIIEKEASDAFHDTSLEPTLRRLGVASILLTGMQTEYCVDTTARSALVRGFDVVLVSDGHTTGDSGLSAQQIVEHHNALLPGVVHPGRTIRTLPANGIRIDDAPRPSGTEVPCNVVEVIDDGAAGRAAHGAAAKTIIAGLESYNAATRPDPGASPLTLAVYGGDGSVTAGLLGRIAYSWLRIDVLWVSDELRGHGVGKALMRKAEQIARERGCRGVHLDTHEFQAPGFYERLGYRRFGTLPDYPEPEAHAYYMKILETSR